MSSSFRFASAASKATGMPSASVAGMLRDRASGDTRADMQLAKTVANLKIGLAVTGTGLALALAALAYILFFKQPPVG